MFGLNYNSKQIKKPFLFHFLQRIHVLYNGQSDVPQINLHAMNLQSCNRLTIFCDQINT